jgi:hypothetical protein
MMVESFEMAKSDRMSIEIGDLRDQIENLRSDSLWKELSLAAKFRFLVRLGIKAELAGLTNQLDSADAETAKGK